MNKLIFIISTTILLFVACEYEPSGNNFIDLAPPEDYIPIEISLNDVNPSDTIYLYKETLISIKTNSPNDIQRTVVLLDGQVFINMRSDSLAFIFDPDQLDEGVYKLTVEAFINTGTGSLAEMMGLEGYIGELSWNIQVIHNPHERFEVDYRINEEGFLELYWDNAIPDSYIESYTIHAGYTQETDITINDAKQKSFVDYGYVCGNALYKVNTFLKDGQVFRQTFSIDAPTPSLYFEDLGLDSFRIYWDKPIANGIFNLMEDKYTLASEIRDTSFIVRQLFGSIRQINLEIKPQRAEYLSYQNTPSVYGKFYQGTSLELPNWPLYAYNQLDNIIYTSRYNELVAFDATTLQEVNAVSIKGNPWGLLYGGKIATAPHNSTVAAMTGEETWIFADNRFVNPIIIPQLGGDVNTSLSALTSDDRFFVVEQDSNICKIFSSLTGEILLELPFTYKTIYTFPDFIAVSDNGQFFCASSQRGMEVFEISGTTTNLLYTDKRIYKGVMFVPSQPDKLLLRVGSHIELRQMPGFNLIQTVEVPANSAWFCNIDPASMSLLYYQNDSLKVCEINNLTKTIFKIRSDQSTSRMFNYKLLTYGNGGIYFDINPFLIN